MCCFKLQPGEFLQVNVVFVHAALRLLHPLQGAAGNPNPTEISGSHCISQNRDFIDHCG